MQDHHGGNYFVIYGSSRDTSPAFIPPSDLTGPAWLNETITRLDKIRTGEKVEFTLPPEVDYLKFLVQLGIPERSYEFGGVVNPNTHSVRMQRGFGFGEVAEHLDPHVSYIPPRIMPDGTFEDILFHTHPWRVNDSISHLKIPINSCHESDTDLSSLISERMIEEEGGTDRVVTSIISSRGYLNVMESRGITFDNDALTSSGISAQRVLQIKRILSLAPPAWNLFQNSLFCMFRLI